MRDEGGGAEARCPEAGAGGRSPLATVAKGKVTRGTSRTRSPARRRRRRNLRLFAHKARSIIGANCHQIALCRKAPIC